MAGHSQFANIKHRKEAQDKKRAKLFTQLTKKITIASKSGGTDKSINIKLAIAISNARAYNVPKDRIERAIFSETEFKENALFQMRYNARFENGALFIIEAETDNKNRTISDIRTIITKNGGKIVETGAIEHFFEHLGFISYKKDFIGFDEFFSEVSELNPINIDKNNEIFFIETNPEDLHRISVDLLEKAKFKEIEESKIIWKAREFIKIEEIEQERFQNIIEQLDELQDVENLFSNIIF